MQYCHSALTFYCWTISCIEIEIHCAKCVIAMSHCVHVWLKLCMPLRLLHCVALCLGQCWMYWWSLCLYVAMITDLYMDRATFRVCSLASVRRWADLIQWYAFIVYLCWCMCTRLDLGQTRISGSMWRELRVWIHVFAMGRYPCVVSTWMNLHGFCCVLPSRERTWRVGSRTCLRHWRTVTSTASWLSLRHLKFHFVYTCRETYTADRTSAVCAILPYL